MRRSDAILPGPVSFLLPILEMMGKVEWGGYVLFSYFCRQVGAQNVKQKSSGHSGTLVVLLLKEQKHLEDKCHLPNKQIQYLDMWQPCCKHEGRSLG